MFVVTTLRAVSPRPGVPGPLSLFRRPSRVISPISSSCRRSFWNGGCPILSSSGSASRVADASLVTSSTRVRLPNVRMGSPAKFIGTMARVTRAQESRLSRGHPSSSSSSSSSTPLGFFRCTRFTTNSFTPRSFMARPSAPRSNRKFGTSSTSSSSSSSANSSTGRTSVRPRSLALQSIFTNQFSRLMLCWSVPFMQQTDVTFIETLSSYIKSLASMGASQKRDGQGDTTADVTDTKPDVAVPSDEHVETEDGNDDVTTAPPASPNLVQICAGVISCLLRMIQLSVVFGPVLISYPVCHVIGRRQMWLRYLAWSMGVAGPCFIKLAQWAATRPDVFPPDVCESLSVLHTAAPTHSLARTKAIFRESLGVDLSEVFSSFDSLPIASGAIAQVYRARLRSTDQRVAVKVKHPGVDRAITRDLSLLQMVVDVWIKITASTFDWMNLHASVQQFSQSMMGQIDLRKEAANLRRFRDNFADETHIHFPSCVDGLITASILVESFEPGSNVSDFIQLNSSEPNPRQFAPMDAQAGEMDFHSERFRRDLANLGMKAFLKMIFLDNFIHADLHPGNILVRTYDAGHGAGHGVEAAAQPKPEIVLLDVGLVTVLSRQDRRNFIDLFRAVAEGNGRLGAQLMIERQPRVRKGSDDTDKKESVDPVMMERFKDEMEELFAYTTRVPLKDIPVAPLMGRILSLCRQYHVTLDSSFATLVVAVMVLEGIGRQLNADFNLFEEALPMLTKADHEVKREVVTAAVRRAGIRTGFTSATRK
eukprot:TRINITY_DN3975_c0_g1_i1.p1 TRINITY_DN3975_c0_g1~~TRINITY_DN3975_c0_g1_i1.p1  ORF type:complete len:765 (+),score=117.48 TRINITY_DN3975_c0_g1_i1:186-2480(+)